MKDYKKHCEKIREASDKLYKIINEYGRHKTKGDQSVKEGYWSDLWWLACRFREEADFIEGLEENLKDFIKEEIAREVLLDKKIDLDKIINRYTDEY